ncbi:MAG: hypothetical protein V3V25_01715 [Paracoccaceae bacterium]
MTQPDENGGLVVTAVFAGLAFLMFLEISALQLTDGVFEYPLDDVYIHLAMAEGIGNGGYGINPDEYSSAASSALYPLLLLPVFPADLQRYLPLFWNLTGLVLSATLWAKLLVEGGYTSARLRPIGYGLAFAGPIALLMSSTAFLGMEHTLHAAASLAILLGLVRHLRGQTPWLLLFAGILLSPVLRYEGLALSVLACGVLFITGHRIKLLIGLLLALAPLALFSGFLTSIGLDALPNSIQAKQLIAAQADLNFFQDAIAKFRNNISTGGGMILLGFVVAIWAVLALSETIRNGPLKLLALVLITAGAGHLFLGQIGWFNRYEHYILVVLVAGFILLIGSVSETLKMPVLAAITSFSLLVPAIWYLPEVVRDFPVSARAIHHQQGQMSAFAKQHLNAPIAVNDIGRLAWNNENHVLDLWGLASAEALALRLVENEAGWADPLVNRHSAQVAMIYDKWFDQAVGPDWVRLGEFRLKERRGFLGSDVVAFYATAPEHVPAAMKALESWVPGLDPLTYFEYTRKIE